MRKLELDDQGKLSIGPVSGTKPGAINVAFASNDTDGIAMNVEASPAAGSAKAAIKLGAFTIGQDVTGVDEATFGIADANGDAVFNSAKHDQAMRYLLAVNTPTIWHVNEDTTTLAGLAALDTGAGKSQTLCNARANLLKAACATHSASVGTYLVAGSHYLADAVNDVTIAAVAAASNLATSITLCTALLAFMNAHATQTAVHTWDDDVGTNATVTDSTPGDLAAVALCLNELTAIFQAHFIGAAEVV